MKNKNIFFSRKNSNTEESFWSPHIKISAMDRSASTTFYGFYFVPPVIKYESYSMTNQYKRACIFVIIGDLFIFLEG